ncbi:hypothetical protein DLAC_04650 [Tieghemostelium lacteum]|uniref:SAC domain-containing protein n=1 Tax=Tieghemostelium lacteum TaxID=361077 RepID=A0A151ZKL1_TIELA|nr:hypothetical protein DLAC_04650 [Tieghemostelium lacteum]|eukprot:KYQ94354.1 hypothetical protein DLAC_04650 [Tieghemostelium lacteum]
MIRNITIGVRSSNGSINTQTTTSKSPDLNNNSIISTSLPANLNKIDLNGKVNCSNNNTHTINNTEDTIATTVNPNPNIVEIRINDSNNSISTSGGSNSSALKLNSNNQLFFNEEENESTSEEEEENDKNERKDSFSLDQPLYNFLSSNSLENSFKDTYINNSNDSTSNGVPKTTSTFQNQEESTDISANYFELHQEMFITKLKDKILIIPMKLTKKSNNNNSNNNSKKNIKTSIDPTLPSQIEECLVIDRNSCSLSTQSLDVSQYLATINSTASIDKKNNHLAHGIIGIISLLSGSYLLTISQKSLIGILNEKQIFRIENCNLLLIPNDKELTEHEKKMESAYKKSLKSLLKSNFYFSYDLDISNSLQRTATTFNGLDKSLPQIFNLYEMFDQRFYWNKNMQSAFISKQLNHWILPLIRGYVEIFNFFLESNSFEFALISRRSIFRAGTRYNTRGSDLFGNVANYVETEQILYSTCITGRKTFSFVQTRGSIPLIWEQSGRKIKPEIKINPDVTINKTSFKLHFDQQIKYYGNQTIVTLLDQKGSEAELGDSYRNTLNSLDYSKNVEYFAFDFHHFCQGGRFDRVDILMDYLEEKIQLIGYMEKDHQYQSYQDGLIRTNCLDCLDRTNLVQSMIGTSVISNQLLKLGFVWSIKDQTPLSKQIKLAWANNGDAVSFQYAGTGALKGDFTRTGKRNTKGVVKDGVNSLTRYYINNFLDRIRQVSIDLFLGSITVEANTYSIIQKEYDWSESRMDAINSCVDHFLKSDKDDEQSGFINAWIVISINKRNQEQERILLLTKTHLVRCKYNFNENKIVHCKKTSLSTLKRIQIGSIKTDNNKKSSYGFKLCFSEDLSSSSSGNGRTARSSSKMAIPNANNGTPENNTSKDDDLKGNLYFVPIPEGETIEFGKDLVNEIIDIIKEGFLNLLGYANISQLSFGQNFIVENNFKRKQNSLVVSAYNGLKLGFYSKSPTISTGGKPFNRQQLTNSTNKANTISPMNSSSTTNNSNQNNNNNNNNFQPKSLHLSIDKRRSKSFDASEFTNGKRFEFDKNQIQ